MKKTKTNEMDEMMHKLEEDVRRGIETSPSTGVLCFDHYVAAVHAGKKIEQINRMAAAVTWGSIGSGVTLALLVVAGSLLKHGE
jgi:hypothetical protein